MFPKVCRESGEGNGFASYFPLKLTLVIKSIVEVPLVSITTTRERRGEKGREIIDTYSINIEKTKPIENFPKYMNGVMNLHT